MDRQIANRTNQRKTAAASPARGLLQRECGDGYLVTASSGPDDGLRFKPVAQQSSLESSEPGDVCEREADRIANQVASTSTTPAVGGAPSHILRIAGQPSAPACAAEPVSVDRVLASPGSPLSPTLRKDMEQRFGHDFSRVRVHIGEDAEQSARDMMANAYTVGHNIVFGMGRFAPGTHEGRRLLAHELTHVIQQRAADLGRLGSVDAHPPRGAIQRQKKEKSPIELEMKERPGLVAGIENNWKAIRAEATDFDDVKPWLEIGDAVVRLIREHTDLAVKALEDGGD